MKKQELLAEFIVCFAFKDDRSYRVLLIPAELIHAYQTISIPENGKSKWFDYEVNPEDLAPFFKEAASLAA